MADLAPVLARALEAAKSRAQVEPQILEAQAAKKAKQEAEAAALNVALKPLAAQLVRSNATPRARLNVCQTNDLVRLSFSALKYNEKLGRWQDTGNESEVWTVWHKDGVYHARCGIEKQFAQIGQCVDWVADRVGERLILE